MWDVTDPAHPVRTADPSGRSGGQAYAVAFSPDGRSLTVGREQPVVTLWDVGEGLPDRGGVGRFGDVPPPDRAVVAVAVGGQGEPVRAERHREDGAGGPR